MTRTKAVLWSTARTVALVATLALLAGLVLWPEPSLTLLWTVVIPLVPASLLVSPLLWRNTCPLATLNMLGSRVRRGRIPSARWASATPALGIALLAAMVPARRFVFNSDGTLLAATVAAVALGAVALGVVFDARAGFCNALCPVLPVERLYGQNPLLVLEQTRCAPCTGCTRACLDLGPGRSARHAIGPDLGGYDWLTTPFGAFAGAFPGFVLGYFLTADGGWSAAAGVYLTIGALAVVSWLVVFGIVLAFDVSGRRLLPVLAALAAGTYYVFSAPPLAAAIGLAEPAGEALRIAFLALVSFWLWRALARSRTPGTSAI